MSCPECGEQDHWYRDAVPTGKLVEQSGRQVVQLRLDPFGGHCLKCGHEEPRREIRPTLDVDTFGGEVWA